MLIQESHPGYINWAQYLKNQERLKDNRTDKRESRGAAREGGALLQGIVICGKCGQRMSLRYRDHSHYYRCQLAAQTYGEPQCQVVRGAEVDAAIADLLLGAMIPAQLRVSLQALEQVELREKEIERHWQLRLERAEYEADLARRRYAAVDPENRLVARNLERDWNEKLTEVVQLERESAAAARPSRLVAGPEERARVLSLARDFPTLWAAETTSNAERKELLRFLISDVTLARGDEKVHLGVRWQTSAVSEVDVPHRRRVGEFWRTPEEVIDRIRNLAAHQTDRQIAEYLNAEGLSTGAGKVFDRERVRRVRLKYDIPADCPEMPDPGDTGPRGDGRYSAQAAARLLNLSLGSISRWCRTGKLESVQARPRGPRWIRLTPEIIARLSKPVKKGFPRN